ncbi:uncharacterized protein GGS22DRAFT_116820 [Annulohypoxylon maeteangense]|uniref:uncharacterized protein n=1 Tax=Annulohypoxylon maeteangense TaxID=1927788 RepID=UPI00200733CE|nr:uncharacterized protein GGS22DRAFT_116820 [Annulohypoxylon maeteangense]KAI0886713.1 hypothetical protein GGS22DRAFT_116820 [Annulohypoxylon maeteangense]
MAHTSEETQVYDSTTFWVAPARNFRSSARLHLQHLLFQNTLGHILEPNIQTAVADHKELKVADLGCGNGVWLNDLDRELSSKGVSAQLDGYDIHPTNFLAPAFLPPSVTLKKLDILARPLPEDIIGTYDIVHARALTSIVVKSDLAPILSTALALLKPGGWLQWEESRADTYFIEPPAPEISTSACDTIVQLLQAAGKARGSGFEFLGELGRHVEEFGFSDVRSLSAKLRRQDLKAWTEDYLMVWEELYVFFPPKAKEPQAPMTREAWINLFAKAVEETEKGVVVHQGEIVSVVGRKPI